MKQLVSTEILIGFLILLLLSNLYYIFFEKTGMILVILAGVLLVFLSQYFRTKLRGLVLFWIGTILLLFALLSNPYNLVLLFSALVILAVRYLIIRRKPIHVIATETDELHISRQYWFNAKTTPAQVYKFEDIHLQHAVGDIYIDLTNAANLSESSVIVVHNIIGKTTIVVPHRYQTKIDYSSMFGQLKVDDTFTRRSKNERLTYTSPAYENGIQIKIMASSIVGDLEVIHR